MTSHTNTTLPILTGSESQRSSVLNTLAYFDIFNYPLKKEEILQYSEIYLNKKDLEGLEQNNKGDDVTHNAKDIKSRKPGRN